LTLPPEKIGNGDWTGFGNDWIAETSVFAVIGRPRLLEQ
jgi:hypothetical protein